MLMALVDGKRIAASPKVSGVCPQCSARVIAKCGEINIWHWAHVSAEDCDSWHKSESDWHLAWKDLFPEDFREVVLSNHRADVKLPTGYILEFQNSPISSKEIREREDFYERKNLIWIFNKSDVWNEGRFEVFDIEHKSLNFKVSEFTWKSPQRTLWGVEAMMIFDFGDDRLFQVSAITDADFPTRGIGLWRNKYEFVDQLISGVKKPWERNLSPYYPMINKPVKTPKGLGRLLQIYSDGNCRVSLENSSNTSEVFSNVARFKFP